MTILLVRHAEPIAPGDPRCWKQMPMPAVYRLSGNHAPRGSGFGR